MNVADIFLQLRQAGAGLALKGDSLRLSAPPNALPPALLANIREHKQVLMAYLSEKDGETQGIQPIRQDAEGVYYPTDYVQQREWILYRLKEDRNFFNIQFTFGVTDIRTDLLEGVVRFLISRHESLRTCFRQVGGELVQWVLQPDMVQLPVTYADLSDEALAEQISKELMRRDNETSFDLEAAPLFRVQCHKVSTSNFVIGFTTHHVVSDNFSINILKQEMAHIYACLLHQQPIQLPAVLEQYSEYIQRRQARQHQQRSYWLSFLKKGLPPLKLARLLGETGAQKRRNQYTELRQTVDRLGIGAFPAMSDLVQRYQAHEAGEYKLYYGEPVLQRFVQLSQEWSVSLMALFMTTFSMALRLVSDQQRVVFDIPVVDRHPKQNESTMGWLTAGVYCEVVVDERLSFQQSARRVHQHLQGAMEQAGTLISSLYAEAGLPEESEVHILLNYLQFPGDVLPTSGPNRFHKTSGLIAYFDLFCMLGKYENGFEWITIYRTDTIAGEDIEALHTAHTQLIHELTQADSAEEGMMSHIENKYCAL